MRWAWFSLVVAALGCGDPRASGPISTGCTPNATQACLCAGGGMGVQTCDASGVGFGVCAGCPTLDGAVADTSPALDGPVADTSPTVDRACVPNCSGRTCGDDGCGGVCGVCPAGQSCNGTSCVAMMTCTPNCAGRMCGPDGCGGMCGECPSGGSCNPMTGQCCTPNCAGRFCGSDGCGGTCGTCTAGLVCDTARGSCTPTCTPSCGGRNCGPNNCGTGSCGTCAAGQACSPSGTCTATCFARPGDTCTSDADCCADRGVTTRCVLLTGVGQVCTAACGSGTDCASGCCVSLTDGTRACNIPLFCASNAMCRASVGQACARDADCCRETAGRRNPTACTCFGSDCSCAALCSQNSDCLSGCCARRDDGVRICAAASACGG